MTPSTLARHLMDHPSGSEAAVEDGERLTYGQLSAATASLGARLRAAGVGAGDRVAFCGRPGLGFLVAWLGILSADATYVSINPAYRAPEMRMLLDDAAPRLVLASAGLGADVLHELAVAASLSTTQPPVTIFDRVRPFALPKLAEPADATRDIALIVYTSGTTGVPKGALLRASSVLAAAAMYEARFGRVRMLHNLPVNHVGGLVDTAAFVLLGGGTLVFMPSFDPERIPSVLEAERVSLWGQVPVMFDLVFAHGDLEPRDLSALRQIVWSGAPVSPALFDRMDALGAPRATCYGLTESTGSVTFSAPNAARDVLLHTVGRPANSAYFRIASGDTPVSTGESGEIQLCGELVSAGYHRNPEATSAAFAADGWFRTGDLASQDADGSVRLVGRMSEMFKSGGYNVYPREIEITIEAFPGVEMVAVLPEADPVWSEVGHAFLTSRLPLSEAELRAFCRQRLANYKIPKRFTVTTELPLLPIGKIDKQALRRGLERHA